MHLKRPPRHPRHRPARLDTLMDTYLRWCDESHAVAECYRHWHFAAGLERRITFDQYVAALDREEEAARVYRQVAERAGGA